MNKELLKNSRLTLSKSTLITRIDNEDIVFDALNGIYFRINNSGKTILDLLQKKITVEEIINEYRSIFDLSESHAEKDVIDLSITLIEKKIVRIA